MPVLNENISLSDIYDWLTTTDFTELHTLFQYANEICQRYKKNFVHLRGLVEISNYCVRQCAYCGINCLQKHIPRYRMTKQEILDLAQLACKYKYGTIVLQAGEDYGIKTEWLADIISEIKNNTTLAITLSLGERPHKDFEIWKKAGADRYLLRFETSNATLYEKIHPNLANKISDRIQDLQALRKIGYEIGSGVMVGIPGQTYEDLANDIQLFQKLDLDMIGIGPYLPAPNTLLTNASLFPLAKNQVPNNEITTLKAVSLTRIVCPTSNIPSTTALSTLAPDSGRVNGLLCGANVIMPNLTPAKYSEMYQIYPNKNNVEQDPDTTAEQVYSLLASMNRQASTGKGDRWESL
ncbi:MAG: [FeFe] hydrogenase H-cluster radical SAM maturase HydE [Planctomycetes bacterium]|jgi:biotin synthase|nr:[FeFe] hydrogenase H-cluster radical SAM maturase HydE [Planctomycetota bacterium]HNZ67297.1 [FeFe] hydrogenase H-cluster radical SAM maturase HydE [Planctomycetota bacterium]HPY73965.1 [FeFe] hydrogenase H-cluster radical SAM maturase HydE [Planctomycetota bacterium]HQA99588.1 [FeFe] hydrogenase H-cluster radical SAM maturase HydE [Planctomycetota bacterium]